MFIRITDQVSVAPQIAPDDMALARAQGFTTVINNRPDGEASDQPSGAVMRAAATAAGLHYAEIPIDHSGFSRPQVDAMAAELAAAEGGVLAYCRSGTRSCNLWALAEAARGEDADTLIAAAAAGGYDISGLRPILHSLAGRG